MPVYSLPVHVHIGEDEDWVYDYKDEQIVCFLARRHAQQCYSELRIAGRHRFTVMWDSGCTLRGLITEEKAKDIIRRFPGLRGALERASHAKRYRRHQQGPANTDGR